jgi:radical SAM protein with 4Fe4S-binding SPASM domain
MDEAERIEHFLSRASVRRTLQMLTRQRAGGDCLLADVMAAYGRPGLPWRERLKYGLPHLGMEWLRQRTGTSRARVRDAVLRDRAWFRGLVNAARGVAEFGLSRPQVFSAPLTVVWHLSQACNLQCQHCCQNAGTPRGVELSRSEKLSVLDELAANDVPLLTLSGGEPLLAPDFWLVLGQARERGFHVSVATNGTLLSREVVDRLARTGADYVEVSIDSTRPGAHNNFRGSPGCWDKALDGLRALVEDGRMQTGLACTVTAPNVDELEDVIRLSADLHVGTFHALNFVPTGRARELAELDLTPDQRERMLEILQAYRDIGSIAVAGTAPQLGRYGMQHHAPGRMVALGHYGACVEAAPLLAQYLGGCGAGRSVLAVQANGDLTPCSFLPLVIGNLRRHHLRDLWRDSPVLRQLRDRTLLQGPCGQCPWRACCGGCRARAWAYFDDLAAPDPGCLFNADAGRRVREQTDTPMLDIRQQSACLSRPRALRNHLKTVNVIVSPDAPRRFAPRATKQSQP